MLDPRRMSPPLAEWKPTEREAYRNVMIRRLHKAKQWLDQATEELDRAAAEHIAASKALDDFEDETTPWS